MLTARNPRINKPGPAYAYDIKALRNQEISVARKAEKAYEHFVGNWQTRAPKQTVRGRLNPARRE